MILSNSKYDFRSFMNIRAATSPSFSHDGKYILFLTNITGTPQVWKVSLKGGWPEQYTYYDEQIKRVYCSPVEELVTFELDPGGSERDQLYLLSPKTGVINPLATENDVIHNLGPWSHDGRKVAYSSNSRNRTFFDIYIWDVNTEKSVKVLKHNGANYAECWSHDGRLLLIKRQNTNLDTDFHIFDLKTKEIRCLTAHSGEASYAAGVFTPDDKSILCITNRNLEFSAIVSIDVKTNKEKVIAKERWDIDGLALNPDGNQAAYTVNEDGYSKLSIKDFVSEKVEEIGGLPLGVASEVTWSPDGKLIAFAFSGSRFNSDIWVYDTKGKEALQLTKSDRGGIPQEAFVEPELIHFKTFDGLSIPAYIYTSKNWKGKKPPVILNVHGGPENQSRPSFNAVNQYLVNNGFTVLFPNVRGSTGYGKTYVHLDDVRKRMDSVQDLTYAHKWLVDSGRIDPKRIVIYGGSYGGFMVLSALTTYPELWAAGIDFYGIANFLSFLENTGPWRRKQRAAEYGDPVRDAAFLKEISPIHKADKIKAPLLVVHGVNDPRVPKSETDQMVEALKKRGIAVEYVLFNDEGHGIVKLKNRLTAYNAIIKFLQKHLDAKS